MSASESKREPANDHYSVSNKPTGPWDGVFPSREAVMNTEDFTQPMAADYLDDNGKNEDWYIRHPDGRVEQVEYFGASKGFVETPPKRAKKASR